MGKLIVDVENIEQVTNSVYRITLCLGTPISFLPGQYLKLWLNNNEFRSYSIASSDCTDGRIIIFISFKANTNSVAELIFNNLSKTKLASVSLPFGDAYYRVNDTENIFIIIEGTGYSYGRSIVLEAIKNDYHKNICFIWKVRNSNEVFENDFLFNLKRQYKKFNFLYCIDDPIELFCDDIISSDKADIYLAASPETVKIVREKIVTRNHINNKKSVFCDLP